MEGTVLYFKGRMSSPFHTTRQEYANFLKTAPFIMGSTLRGAILDYLIRIHCKDDSLAQLDKFIDPVLIANFHCACTEDCPVGLFFTEKPLIWFSFAQFEDADYQVFTRIGIARDTRSVAEGSIFNLETIVPGTQFAFEIFLFGLAQELEQLIVEAVNEVGSGNGIGHARSIGFGRFEVIDFHSDSFEHRLAMEKGCWPPPGGALKIVFKTPYVLDPASAGLSFQNDFFAHSASEQIYHTASIIQEGSMNKMAFSRAEVQVHPEFIGRFSYERKLRENRLVAWPGSSLTCYLNGEEDSDQLAIAAVLGIGPWNNWGFGRFHIL